MGCFGLIGLAFIMGSLYLGITSFRKSQYKGDVEYYRDLPYMSPAAAARMNDVMSASSSILGSGKIKNGDKLVNRQMSSTVMSLASKGAIAIYPGPAKLYDGIDLTTTNAASVAGRLGSDAATARKMKKTSTIVIMPVARNDIGSLLLSSSEHAALDILLKASSRLRDTQVFDLKQMNKAFKHYKKGYKLLQDFDTACSTEFDNLRAVDSSRGFLNNLVGILGLVFAFYKGVQYAERGEIAVTMSICVPVVLACAFALVYGKYHALTDNGQKYGGQVAGLKRYLLDFSDFSDRGVLDMTLWGRYMVYATAFGISDKVMAQLTKAYPEVADPQWLDEHAASSYMYMPLHSSSVMGASTGAAVGASVAAASVFSANYGDFGAQLSSSFRRRAQHDFHGGTVLRWLGFRWRWFRRFLLRWRFRRRWRWFRRRFVRRTLTCAIRIYEWHTVYAGRKGDGIWMRNVSVEDCSRRVPHLLRCSL